MAERWAVDFVEAIRGQSASGGAVLAGELLLAEVQSANPLTLRTHDQLIQKGLFLNPGLTVYADDGSDKIAQAFENAPEPMELFDFLKLFHQRFVIRRGDTVVLLQSKASFYILAKVAPA